MRYILLKQHQSYKYLLTNFLQQKLFGVNEIKLNHQVLNQQLQAVLIEELINVKHWSVVRNQSQCIV